MPGRKEGRNEGRKEGRRSVTYIQPARRADQFHHQTIIICRSRLDYQVIIHGVGLYYDPSLILGCNIDPVYSVHVLGTYNGMKECHASPLYTPSITQHQWRVSQCSSMAQRLIIIPPSGTTSTDTVGLGNTCLSRSRIHVRTSKQKFNHKFFPNTFGYFDIENKRLHCLKGQLKKFLNWRLPKLEFYTRDQTLLLNFSCNKHLPEGWFKFHLKDGIYRCVWSS